MNAANTGTSENETFLLEAEIRRVVWEELGGRTSTRANIFERTQSIISSVAASLTPPQTLQPLQSPSPSQQQQQQQQTTTNNTTTTRSKHHHEPISRRHQQKTR